MKKIGLLILFICLFLTSCDTKQSVTVCHKDSQSNFGQMSAMDDEGNIFYVCDDKIYFLKKSGDVKTVAEGDDVTWITVSDYIYCVEENDTIVCYEKDTGEKLAEYEFDADKIVVKSIGDKLLLFSVENEYPLINYKEYIVRYVKNDFEVKEFSSGDNFDGGITNKFVSVNELDNVYIHYDEEGQVSDPGDGYDDIYFLEENEYFGLKILASDYYNFLPFFHNNDMYMSNAYWIFGPILENNERLKLPADIHADDIVQYFQYGDLIYMVAEKNERIRLFTLDLNERVFEELSVFENTNISEYIGHIDDTVYYSDGNNDVYSCCLSEGKVELIYKSTNDTDKHYEICGDKLFICEYDFFCENVEVVNLTK